MNIVARRQFLRGRGAILLLGLELVTLVRNAGAERKKSHAGDGARNDVD